MTEIPLGPGSVEGPVTGTCGTCKHWAEGAQGHPGLGTCQAIPHQDDADPAALAVLNETCGVQNAWLESRAEFGCVLHEVKS